MTDAHKRAISASKVGKKLSEQTKAKIGLANRSVWVTFKCDFCGKDNEEKQSHYKKKKRHFCNQECYSNFRKLLLPIQEQHAYRGIWNGSKQIYHQRYVKKHPETISHLKARRYARERGAEGDHTLQEWEELKKKFNNLCAFCNQEKPLTKDHIIPLSEGGSDFITNIQPLCRNCNSKKWKKITVKSEKATYSK